MLEALILGSLAVWRLTHLLQEETGPMAVFDNIRSRVWVMKNTDGGFREGFFCFKCLSLWLSIIFIILYFLIQPIFFFLTILLAVSAVSIFIDEWYKKNE